MKKLLLAFAALTTLATTACDVSSDGANGNVTFTPTNCGRSVICDFSNSIGVGGTIDLNIAGVAGVSTAGTTVVSDSPNILAVTVVPDVAGMPTWELQGLASGIAILSVVTAANETLDFLEVPVQDLTALVGHNTLGNAVGPASAVGYDEVWTVNADTDVSFQIAPTIGLESPTMGKYVYTATIDSGLESGLLETDLSDGYLYFNVPAGTYDASFENDFGLIIRLQIIAQ